MDAKDRGNIMLILTRKVGESIHIGDDVKVTVLGVKGGQMRIGIDAPNDVPIHREELLNKKQTPDAIGSGTEQMALGSC